MQPGSECKDGSRVPPISRRDGGAVRQHDSNYEGSNVFIVRSSAAGAPQLRPGSLPPSPVSPRQRAA